MASIDDPFTYVEAMERPQRDHRKIALEKEHRLILFNNTFSALNSWEAQPPQVRSIGSIWVYKTKHNPDRSTWYEAGLAMKGYQ
jgi:hypothetical protein